MDASQPRVAQLHLEDRAAPELLECVHHLVYLELLDQHLDRQPTTIAQLLDGGRGETGGDADNYLNASISALVGAVACLPGVVEIDCLFPSGIAALVPDGEFTRSAYTQDSDTLALFAHATIGLTDRLDLTAGLRYSIEDKTGGADNQFWYDSAIVRAVLAAAGLPDDGTARNGFDLIGTLYSPSFTDETSDNETTGLISLTYHISDDVMVYGGYHRGFKAGGVNLFREGVVTNTTIYAPETADSFEFGFKSQYWDGRAISNISLFHTEFSDLQINFFTGLEFRTENTGEASTTDEDAERYLRNYIERTSSVTTDSFEPRKIGFRPGHREKFWHRNCVAVGMSAGFLEPLEASALVLVELAAKMISEELPANRGVMDIVAKRYNEKFLYRWDRIIDFLKLHYVLSKRSDSEYWKDNRRDESIPESLRELLELWQYHVPGQRDFPQNEEVFSAASYQYVLYGMGFETHARAGSRQSENAKKAQQLFVENIKKANQIVANLPDNRTLLTEIGQQGLPINNAT